jgi:hypothetical protein
MKHTILAALAIAVTLIFLHCVKAGGPYEDSAESEQTREDTIKHGDYLVSIMGCHDCHSPKRMGANGQPELIPELMLSGYPSDRAVNIPSLDALQQGYMLMGADLTSFIGPWGMSFAGNLTSDETGTGNWTLEQFKKALTEGKYKGLDNARNLLPPMPVEVYRHLNDYDISAIFTYLQSTNPVRNVVPPPMMPDQLLKG